MHGLRQLGKDAGDMLKLGEPSLVGTTEGLLSGFGERHLGYERPGA